MIFQVQHPPSYCVQSVVVGGKADPVEEKKNKTSSFDPPFDPMAAVGLSGGFQDPQNLDPAQNASEQLNNVDRSVFFHSFIFKTFKEMKIYNSTF